eukprot:814751-Amphidinium_carterae.1
MSCRNAPVALSLLYFFHLAYGEYGNAFGCSDEQANVLIQHEKRGHGIQAAKKSKQKARGGHHST